jgi:hypothetical protein
MFERDIEAADVRRVLETGEVIESYPDDQPYPSQLMLGWIGNRPLHVVAASNDADQETYIITVYEPDPVRWKPGMKERAK